LHGILIHCQLDIIKKKIKNYKLMLVTKTLVKILRLHHFVI